MPLELPLLFYEFAYWVKCILKLICAKKIFFGWSHPHNWITSLFIQVFFRMFWTFFKEIFTFKRSLGLGNLLKEEKLDLCNKKIFNLFFAEVFGEMDLHSHYRNISSVLKSEKNVGIFFLIWDLFYPHNSILHNTYSFPIFSQLLCRMLLL